jgi:hypothetical protein
VDKVALAVGAMIERQTPNTAELANVLPLATARRTCGNSGCAGC